MSYGCASPFIWRKVGTQAISSAPGAQRLDLMDSYTIGFYFGVLAYFAVLGAVYWFVGRWGWIGIAIRAGVIGLAIFRVLALLSHPTPL